ncbi:MAG: hypothetical protein QF704_15975 [Anaerolineales bacterium]|jgi:NAD-dependent dihydropyrimidine dehydrogenase PreA subunit|nr:hypothetical protein [Anaerolineales bacterium]
MGMFIHIDVNRTKLTPDQAESLVNICPVDIFFLDDNIIDTNSNREDECTLCELCLETSPKDAIAINKSYSDERLVSYAINK